MSLFGMLGTTARALDAQRFGLDVVGNNLANVNTAGYTRRTIDFGAVPPPDRFSAGNGVEVLGVRSLRDRLYDQRLFDERPLEQQQEAIADALGLVEVALGQPGQSLDTDLADFFDAFADLADAPTSSTARQQVLAEGDSLARAFNGLASRLDDAASTTDARVREDVDAINALTARIASLNQSIAESAPAETLHLRDEQIEAVKTLSGLIGTQVVEHADGTLQISTRSGRPLVIGDQAYALQAVSAPPSGAARIEAGGVDITADVTDGHLGGLLQVRDRLIPGYLEQLDQLAYGVAMEVNALHATGFDLAGNPGGQFFTAPAGVAGAASALSMDPTLMASPDRLAASAVSTSLGDNQIARALANLRDGVVANGRTADQAWATLTYAVSADTNRASAEYATRKDIVQQIEQLRDSVSGVSIDEEAALMMRFQRAYEANARFFTVVDETLQTLLSLKR